MAIALGPIAMVLLLTSCSEDASANDAKSPSSSSTASTMTDRKVIDWKEVPAQALIGGDAREVAGSLTPFDAKYDGEKGQSIGGGVPYQLGGRTIATTFMNATEAAIGKTSEVAGDSVIIGACVHAEKSRYNIVLNVVSRENATTDVVMRGKQGKFPPEKNDCNPHAEVPFPVLEKPAE